MDYSFPFLVDILRYELYFSDTFQFFYILALLFTGKLDIFMTKYNYERSLKLSGGRLGAFIASNLQECINLKLNRGSIATIFLLNRRYSQRLIYTLIYNSYIEFSILIKQNTSPEIHRC